VGGYGALMNIDFSKARVFVVTLQNLAPFISQMSYEKSDKDIKLYFTLKEAAKEGLKLLPAELTPEALLLERILTKTERNQEKKLCVSSLATQDFQQTGANSKMLPNVIERLRSFSEPGFSYGVTFEEHKSKKGLLWTQNPSIIEEYKQMHRGVQKGNWILWRV